MKLMQCESIQLHYFSSSKSYHWHICTDWFTHITARRCRKRHVADCSILWKKQLSSYLKTTKECVHHVAANDLLLYVKAKNTLRFWCLWVRGIHLFIQSLCLPELLEVHLLWLSSVRRRSRRGGHEKLGRNLCEQWFVDYWWKKINITHKKNLLNFVNRPNSPLSPIKHGDYQVKSTSTWWHSVWTVSMSGNIKINIFKITPAFKMVDIVARSFNSKERTKCQWLSLPGQIRSKNIVMSILAAADLYILSIYSCIIWELQSSHLL